ESINGGISFTSIEGNLPDMPVRWGVFAPASAQLNGPTNGNGGILLATELGVWTTSRINGLATTWIPNSADLPNVRTDMVKWRAVDGLAVAATHGRGLYTTVLGTSSGGGAQPVSSNFIKYISSSGGNLLIVSGTAQSTKMILRIFDAKGSLVYQASNGYSTTNISIATLSTGVYIIDIAGDQGEKFTGKFIRR
ncbi:MAG: T9SS type A sorting domain-containing protein, partial [Chitinophagaceae bacterium]